MSFLRSESQLMVIRLTCKDQSWVMNFRKHLKLIARVVLQLQTKDTFPKGILYPCHLINHILSLPIRRHLWSPNRKPLIKQTSHHTRCRTREKKLLFKYIDTYIIKLILIHLCLSVANTYQPKIETLLQHEQKFLWRCLLNSRKIWLSKQQEARFHNQCPSSQC